VRQKEETSPKQTILIVDDAPGNIEILGEALRPDYEVLVATSGPEALEVASREKPDLMLLDVMMPDMGGYEVIKALKGNHKLRDMPVVFITALDKVDQETQGLELGAVDYITRPFNVGIVKLRVKNHLELKSQRDMLARSNARLQEALAKIKTLRGLIPICAGCKRIRDDQGYWNQLESYISDHSDAEFSHGLCPECIRRLYPEYHAKLSQTEEKASEDKGG
jgi:PleD family two-component response regulator